MMQIIGFIPCDHGFVLIRVLDDHLKLLLHGVGNTNDHIPVTIQGYRLPGNTVRQFNRDDVIFIVGFKLQNQVITFLKGWISGESGVFRHVVQRTKDFIIFDADSRLQVFYILAQYIRLIVFGTNGETD